MDIWKVYQACAVAFQHTGFSFFIGDKAVRTTFGLFDYRSGFPLFTMIGSLHKEDCAFAERDGIRQIAQWINKGKFKTSNVKVKNGGFECNFYLKLMKAGKVNAIQYLGFVSQVAMMDNMGCIMLNILVTD